jgi:hypothetical protein
MSMTATTYRVDILTKDLGLLMPESTGLPEPIQAIRLIVTGPGGARSHVVVRSGTAPFAVTASYESLRRLFPGCVISVVRRERGGTVMISCEATDEVERFGAASSVATVKRSWGWDESPSIRVEIDDDPSDFEVNPVFDGRAWLVIEPNAMGDRKGRDDGP